MAGPLSGIRVIELQGRGPGPFGAMVLAATPGHDINYVALAGALDPPRRDGLPPAPPLNFLGDYGDGGMLLVTGILSALVERAMSGQGQVVDAAMIDGVALLTTLLHGMRAEGLWSDIPAGLSDAAVDALLASGTAKQATALPVHARAPDGTAGQGTATGQGDHE